MPITKAIIAVAGYGTRFIPATKVQPKEMLPIVDKPVVQYLVEEAVASGVTDIVLVTRSGNQAVEDHFDSSRELELHLETQKKWRELEEIRRISSMANFIFIRQGKDMPYGNGTPLLCAKPVIHPDEAVVYMFGDDIVKSEVPCVRQLIDVYERYRPAGVVAVQEVPLEEISRYGVPKLKPGSDRNPLAETPLPPPPCRNRGLPQLQGTAQQQGTTAGDYRELEHMVEKPSPAEAPSNLAQLGRFVFSYQIIRILEHLKTGKGGELWLTDAINELAATESVIVHPIAGKWFTTGDPLRFLKTTVEFALDRPDIGPEFATYLQQLDLSRFRAER